MRIKIEGNKVLSEAPACYEGPNCTTDANGTKWVQVATMIEPNSTNPGITFNGTYGALLVARVAEAVLTVVADRLDREASQRKSDTVN